MIDAHAHFLFGVDDGPDSIDISLEMCRIAAEDGVRTIYCTSHLNAEDYTPRALAGELERRAEVRGKLQQAARAEGLDLTLKCGAEWMLSPDLLDALPACPDARYDGSRAFLFEISRFSEASFVPQFAQLAVMDGWKPVFAHPERYPSLDERNMHEVLSPLAQLGIPLQLTCASLTGQFGPRPRNMARLIARTFPESIVLSSDAHEATFRIPGLTEGYAELDGIRPGLAEQARKRLADYLNQAN